MLRRGVTLYPVHVFAHITPPSENQVATLEHVMQVPPHLTLSFVIFLGSFLVSRALLVFFALLAAAGFFFKGDPLWISLFSWPKFVIKGSLYVHVIPVSQKLQLHVTVNARF